MPASARVVPDAYKGNSVNMVLDHSLVHDKESAARSLFSLPAHKKLKAARSPGDDQDASAVFRLNFYPSCPDPDRALDLVSHTGSSLVSIAHQINVDGLQVFLEGTGWFTILVVYVGDLMSILSNGLYSIVLHRSW
ncbi:hypothetical protein ACFX16_040226 [Malus domestica]